MPAAHLTLREEDVVRLTLEFLHSRDLHISQVSLERETGIINGQYSDDVLFLRQLILDGQWDDVMEFIQPLGVLPDFDMRKFTYSILRHKYVELLCIKSEANVISGATNGNVDNAVEEVVKVLNDLEKFAPSQEEYKNLCLLLTLPRLTDHFQYKDWNPSNARVQCFREVHPLVEKFLPNDRKNTDALSWAKNDRLIQLIIKGILYESCVNYCQAKATGSKESEQTEMSFARLLDGSVGFSDSDLSLLSWLQSIPSETFAVPFAQRTLNVDVERLERPSLETSWTEHMLITPIKPKTFPHSAISFTRPRSAADMMSRSLVPALEAGLGPRSPGPKNAIIPNAALMALSTGDINNPMSRSSFASFHLTGFKNNKLMNTSVDRLFENEGEVFLSSSYSEFQQLPSIQETGALQPKAPPRTRAHSKSPDGAKLDPATSTPERRLPGRESPAPSTARSSRRDSLTEKPVDIKPTPESLAMLNQPIMVGEPLELSYNGDLFKEYQKQKQKLQETIQQKERERDELVRQLSGPPLSPQVMDNKHQREGLFLTMDVYEMLGQNGKPLLILDEYKFYKHRVNKNGLEVWRCVQKTCRCKLVRLAATGEVNVEKSILDEHNHMRDSNINRQIASNNLKRKLIEEEECRNLRPSLLIRAELNNHEEGLDITLTDISCIRRNIHNTKRKYKRLASTNTQEMYEDPLYEGPVYQGL